MPKTVTADACAIEFSETRQMGQIDSACHSAVQTDIARFWSTNAIDQFSAFWIGCKRCSIEYALSN